MRHWLERDDPSDDPPFHVHLGPSDERETDETIDEEEAPDPRAALAAFARSARIDPDEPDYHFILGQALLDAGRVSEAIPSLREAVALHPREATYHTALGLGLLRRQRYDDAVESLCKATELAPTDADAWGLLGAALVAAGRPAEALRVLDEAQRLAPRRADVWGNRGIALWARGSHADALAAFRAACRHAPDAVASKRNLGLALLARGKADEALAVLEAARSSRPGSSALLTDIGDVLYRLRRFDAAEASYRSAAEVSPTYLETRPASRERFQALSTATMRRELEVARPLAVTAASRLMGVFAGGSRGARRVRGAGPMASRLAMMAAVAVLLAGVARFGPAYVRHFLFVDDLATVAMTSLDDDLLVEERLLAAAEKRRLTPHLQRSSCTIRTRPKWRTIECRYAVPVAVLPGWSPTLHFDASVERPFIDVSVYEVPAGP